MKKKWVFALISMSILGAAACASFFYYTASRFSAIVALVSKGAAIEAFLKRPQTSYVETYFRFNDKLGDDVVFGVDQEFVDGVEKPVYVAGGDWMSAVGLQRNGTVWVATGTDKTMAGKAASERNWKILKLSKALSANTWYRLRCTSDFGIRHFKSLEIEGPGLSKILDLSACKLDYPNYMPFDQRTMSYFVFAFRSRGMMKEQGAPQVLFDDVEGGVIMDGQKSVVFKDGFENQKIVANQPLTSPVIKLDRYLQQHFYLERKEAQFSIEQSPFARSGKCVGIADAGL